MRAMCVLAIDTALNACSVAMIEGERVLAQASEPMQRGHAERIAPMVHEVLTRAGAETSAISRIVVTTGPGSFTGVRVGLAFARAMALALGVPCVGISTLEALALEQGEGDLRGARIPAPGGAYAALYDNAAIVSAPALVSETELLALCAAYPQALWAPPGGTPDIVALARRGAGLDPALHAPNPLYLRAPDAKPAALRTAPA
jgi:tRNA threonylcarbamoyladenosine biosynthesis protein TsaB